MGRNGEHEGSPRDELESPDDRPLSLLADLSYPASSHFIPRVRASIERRVLASHFATGFWSGPLLVLLEFVYVGVGLFSVRADSPPRPGSRNP